VQLNCNPLARWKCVMYVPFTSFHLPEFHFLPIFSSVNSAQRLSLTAKYTPNAAELAETKRGLRPLAPVSTLSYCQCFTCDLNHLIFALESNPGTCTTCLNCWKASADPPVEDFCSPHCKGIVESKSPILLEVPRGHVSFDQGISSHYIHTLNIITLDPITVVENVFKDSWKQVRGPSPSVKKIYMVCLSRTWDDMFGDYG